MIFGTYKLHEVTIEKMLKGNYHEKSWFSWNKKIK